jgi:hypothetical protein
LSLSRLIKVPGSVHRNDELVRNRNEDLRTWVQDDDRAMEADIGAKILLAHEAGVGYGGAPAQIRAKVTSIFEHRYRDQLRTAERIAREVRLGEGLPHRMFRRMRGKPYVLLTAPNEVAEILERWTEHRPASEDLRAV